MKLETADFIHLSEYAIEAARAAGKRIASYLDKEVEVIQKDGGDTFASQVVTKVDYESQEIVLKHLQPAIEQFDLGVLTEETEDDGGRLEKDYFWCIDPIDGTLPFIEKGHGFSVSIALVSKEGIPVIGVIYDPKQSDLFHAISGVGAFKNEEMWFLNQTKPSADLTWVMDRSLKDDPRYSLLAQKIETLAQSKGMKLKMIQHGGGAMNACWVLENKPACYLKLPKKKEGGGSLWDYSASACIFEWIEASVSDVFGDPLELNRAESTFLNHRGVLYASDQQLANEVMKICAAVIEETS